jgi:hypothetical protein
MIRAYILGLLFLPAMSLASTTPAIPKKASPPIFECEMMYAQKPVEDLNDLMSLQDEFQPLMIDYITNYQRLLALPADKDNNKTESRIRRELRSIDHRLYGVISRFDSTNHQILKITPGEQHEIVASINGSDARWVFSRIKQSRKKSLRGNIAFYYDGKQIYRGPFDVNYSQDYPIKNIYTTFPDLKKKGALLIHSIFINNCTQTQAVHAKK